jgi:hypothetical protein
MYFVRGADGRIRTIMSGSLIGAVREYIRKYKPQPGDIVSVKERGRGDWEEYDIK